VTEVDARGARCRALGDALLKGLAPLDPVINGDRCRAVSYIVNVSFPGFDAETIIDAWRDLVAISNGAACSSQSYTCSHVLGAMGLPEWRKDGAVRFSWCAETPWPDWGALVAAAAPFRNAHRIGSTS
jgi:cysteine desulfurase